ncbi:hypothetical protein A946_09690 [Methylacidiphilum kamchatkense Kam1]|uniref:Knr4/Smi1-like domain-containing protein n=1 Tax=Methylacidiphilum kamchatkense Kam1 TaxID=1202785 RepID=A0A0C1UQ06_9BACT|nr:SMI1/KNR4 family protein [Methylacidiphilum kamchatkense]KIE57923.1 hypothetical protein A946_09690 [Methylacidiphilum kamchatkense Kam1]QDQ42351.1 hypothetical protein kam1_1121 [Methylacidiphilum kamchatkense Kam1]
MPPASELQTLLARLQSSQKEHPYIEINPPASLEAIESIDLACQKEFGLALPQDYKELLASANGFCFGYGRFYHITDPLSPNRLLRQEVLTDENIFRNNLYIRNFDLKTDSFFCSLSPPHHLLLGESGYRSYLYDALTKRYYIRCSERYFGVFYPEGEKIPPEGKNIFYSDLYSLLKAELEYFFRYLEPAPRLLEAREIQVIQKARMAEQLSIEGSFLPPASFKAIEQANRRFLKEFGFPIPEFYKKFLAFSNGFRTDYSIFFHIPDEDSPTEWLRTEEHEEPFRFLNSDFLIPHNRYYRSKVEEEEYDEKQEERLQYFIFGQDRDLLEITYCYDPRRQCFFKLHFYYPEFCEEYSDFSSFLKTEVFLFGD